MGFKTKRKTEFGDFQTPPKLAQAICTILATDGLKPAALLEPTCGLGNFLFAALDQFDTIQKGLGAEINGDYVQQADAVRQSRPDAAKTQLVQTDFFVTDWELLISELPEPLLVLGNPPWVTNAQLGVLGSQNLPKKSNFQKHTGLDAVTGKANFDISEWMLIRLFEAMNRRTGTLAMLCKSSTARKALKYAWQNDIGLERAAIYGIDADLHFDAAVDATLLVTHFRPGTHDRMAKVFSRLGEIEPRNTISYEDDTLLADVDAYQRWQHLRGDEALKWRSGIKHDCAKVMELRREGEQYRNGSGELVSLENDSVYPMLKSSQVANGGTKSSSLVMIVTQKTVGSPTSNLQEETPKTWAYLKAHADLLKKRASSIYRNRPEFSIFGVGDYSFAPWKVAISGFYKNLLFVKIAPMNGRPVVLDDTSYFLPCQTEEQAGYLESLLNSAEAQAFYRAFLFWDSKRPITAELLRRLDLRKLAVELGSEEKFNAYFGTPLNKGVSAGNKSKHKQAQLELWPI